MNAIQVTSPLCRHAYLKAAHHVQALPPLPFVSYARGPLGYPTLIKLTSGRQKRPRLMPVCSFRGEASSGDGNQDPLWKSFGKAFENFGKKFSVDDALDQEIEEEEFYDDGGKGRNPPRGRGRGRGGSGGSEDGGFDETMQVILATLALILVYNYIVNGAEALLLFRDFIRYLSTGKKSSRLARALVKWEAFSKRLIEKEHDKFWLEKAIINTRTWWDDPLRHRRHLNAFSKEETEQEEQESNEQESDEQE